MPVSPLPTPAIVLSIAGFDPSTGAGITADLQTFQSHGLFGTACPTALTVQSTMGVRRVQATDPQLLREMLEYVTQDLPPAGIKIGMLANASVTLVVADFLKQIKSQRRIVTVLDPVLRSSSGKSLLEDDGVNLLRDHLLPLVDCLTPNREELSSLLKTKPQHHDLTAEAEALLASSGAGSLVVTGGDAATPDDLVLAADGTALWLRGEHIETSATHGTGCAFSSSLLCHLVRGDGLADAATKAKRFVEQALRVSPKLGSGRGPMRLSSHPPTPSENN